MKNTIIGGVCLVAGIILLRSILDRREAAVMAEKIHSLQDKFKSLDADSRVNG